MNMCGIDGLTHGTLPWAWVVGAQHHSFTIINMEVWTAWRRLVVGTRSRRLAVLLEMAIEFAILLASPPSFFPGERIIGLLLNYWMDRQLVDWTSKQLSMPVVSTRKIRARQVRTMRVDLNFGPVVIRVMTFVFQFLVSPTISGADCCTTCHASTFGYGT